MLNTLQQLTEKKMGIKSRGLFQSHIEIRKEQDIVLTGMYYKKQRSS